MPAGMFYSYNKNGKLQWRQDIQKWRGKQRGEEPRFFQKIGGGTYLGGHCVLNISGLMKLQPVT